MKIIKTTVKLLTLSAIFLLSSCFLIHERYGEHCNSHAYVNRGLTDFIKSRFNYNSPVRLAIVPFSTAANLTAQYTERPGFGNEIAWKLHAYLLESGDVPIVEVFNRQDWPLKKEEFFTGNFGGLAMAREAGYDLVLVGYVEQQRNIRQIDAFVKLMDVESGVTVYYGKISSNTIREHFQDFEDTMLISDKRPSDLFLAEIKEKLPSCISEAILSDEEE